MIALIDYLLDVLVAVASGIWLGAPWWACLIIFLLLRLMTKAVGILDLVRRIANPPTRLVWSEPPSGWHGVDTALHAVPEEPEEDGAA